MTKSPCQNVEEISNFDLCLKFLKQEEHVIFLLISNMKCKEIWISIHIYDIYMLNALILVPSSYTVNNKKDNSQENNSIVKLQPF